MLRSPATRCVVDRNAPVERGHYILPVLKLSLEMLAFVTIPPDIEFEQRTVGVF